MSNRPRIDSVRFQEGIGYFGVSQPEDFIVYDRGIKKEHFDHFRCYYEVLSDSMYNTVIVKVGTNIITHDDARRGAYNMSCIANDIAEIRRAGKKVMIVSSGAIGLGRKARLSIGERIPEEEKDLPEQKVIDASHGQYLLYTLWQHHLRDRTRESLVTHDDLKDFQRRRKLFDGYDSMLDRKIIPIINEDDRRSIEEIDIMLKGERVFRDNDGLASLIASQMSEDNHKVLLVILSNTDGIYTKESCKDNLFTPIRIIEDPENLEEQIFFTTSKRSRGGMISKIEAAKEAAMHGVYVVIANGQYCNHDARFQDGLVKERKYKVLEAILNGYVVGTRFVPARQ